MKSKKPIALCPPGYILLFQHLKIIFITVSSSNMYFNKLILFVSDIAKLHKLHSNEINKTKFVIKRIKSQFTKLENELNKLD